MGQFIVDNNNYGDGTADNNSNYESYYRPSGKKPRMRYFIILFFIILIGLVVLEWGGFLKPKTNSEKQQNLIDRICAITTKYATDNKITGIDISGKIIYVRISKLMTKDLVDSSILDALSSQNIDIDTDIMLTVISNKNIKCEGYAWPSDDKIVPTIKLNGEATVTLAVGSTFKDPGATAIDNRDGDISDNVTRSGTVDLTKAGTYYIYYTVRDRAGNLSEKITRTIIVQ